MERLVHGHLRESRWRRGRRPAFTHRSMADETQRIIYGSRIGTPGRPSKSSTGARDMDVISKGEVEDIVAPVAAREPV